MTFRHHRRVTVLVTIALLLIACTEPAPPPVAAARPAVTPSATTEPGQLTASPATSAAGVSSGTGSATESRNAAPDGVASGPLYFCTIADVRTAIEYDPRVEALCRRHPEMSPCQYARAACRARGGRVYTAAGAEVTLAIESDYDRKVDRVTFPADGPARRAK